MLILSTLAVVAQHLFTTASSSVAALPPGEPALFEENVACSSANSLHRAQRAEDAGRAKSESSVFDLQDGIVAAKLLAEAATCYRAAGQGARAEALGTEARTLREALLGEYKLIRLRLDRALAAGDSRVAEAQVSRLQQLLRHRQDSHLGLALRRLALRLARKN